MLMANITHAQLCWDEHGQPCSVAFDDIYFSKDSGLEESRYVFLAHNALSQRFQQLAQNDVFVIGETGFGSGLNFLCAWQLFASCAPDKGRLHFISVEKFPLTRQDLIKSLALWDGLGTFKEQLINQYEAVHEGFQRFVFDNGRVVLTLLIGDVATQLPKLNASVDAWFLDGFAPAKNPQMWSDDLFKQLVRLSKLGATFATFTSAGFVRRGLQAVGFNVLKAKGFANKREMLHGSFQKIEEPHPFRKARPTIAPWFDRLTSPPFTCRKAIVIGAGVAGASTAASLAQRGWQVIVLERNADIAMGGSGNAQGILYLKLSAHQTLQSRLLVEGFGYTRRLLEQLTRSKQLIEHEDWQNCGVLQLGFDEKEQQRQQQLAEVFSSMLLYPVTQVQASQLAGIEVAHNGLFFPEGGWVKPRHLCRALLTHPNIEVRCYQSVLSIQRINGVWQALQHDKLLAEADIMILANATEAKDFAVTNNLPIKAIRGQTTELPLNYHESKLNTVVCSDGYVSPAKNGKYCIGATFNFHATDLIPNAQEHLENIQMLKTISPQLAHELGVDQLALDNLGARVAYRCTATDYLPIVGPIAERKAFLEDYQVLIKDAKKIPNIPCTWHEGLFLNIAHGSRGLITAPLCGELLANWLENEPFAIEQDLLEACHPNRFYMRELRYFRK